MEKMQMINQSEWPIMELLWESPKTLMELVNTLTKTIGWSKSTITTLVRRMDDKGLITFHTVGRAKVFRSVISRQEATTRETNFLLSRAYHGSVGLMISAMVQQNNLSKADIDELYSILKEAEEGMK
jgi:BlaI family penicillinase repressor